MKHRLLPLALIASLLPLASGCLLVPFFDYDEEEESNTFESCVPWQRDEVDPAGEHSLYVVDSVQFARTAQEASMLGMDFDANQRGDNALGNALAAVFGTLEIDINALVTDMIQDGRILHLIDVQTINKSNAAGAGVMLFLGADVDDDPSDNFSGDEFFEVLDRTASQPMAGNVLGGTVTAELGAFPMQLALPGVDEPFVLDLTTTRIEAAFIGDTLVGTIGGVLSQERVQTELLPIVHLAITRHVSSDCTTAGCVAGSDGELYVELFDRNDDVQVSLDEIVDNDLVQALTGPDLDLIDEGGVVNPGCDGVRESLSLSVGFTAVPAQF